MCFFIFWQASHTIKKINNQKNRERTSIKMLKGAESALFWNEQTNAAFVVDQVVGCCHWNFCNFRQMIAFWWEKFLSSFSSLIRNVFGMTIGTDATLSVNSKPQQEFFRFDCKAAAGGSFGSSTLNFFDLECSSSSKCKLEICIKKVFLSTAID